MADDKVYLGDGAYAAHDGDYVVLTTENGYCVTNTIYLEPEALSRFFRWYGVEDERDDAADAIESAAEDFNIIREALSTGQHSRRKTAAREALARLEAMFCK